MLISFFQINEFLWNRLCNIGSFNNVILIYGELLGLVLSLLGNIKHFHI